MNNQLITTLRKYFPFWQFRDGMWTEAKYLIFIQDENKKIHEISPDHIHFIFSEAEQILREYHFYFISKDKTTLYSMPNAIIEYARAIAIKGLFYEKLYDIKFDKSKVLKAF